MNRSLILGVAIGVMLSGIAVLGAFVYFQLDPVSSAFAGTSRDIRGQSTCDRLENLGGHELIIDFGRFANARAAESDHIMLGRKTDEEMCGLASASLARNLSAGEHDRVIGCIATATTPAAARACF